MARILQINSSHKLHVASAGLVFVIFHVFQRNDSCLPNLFINASLHEYHKFTGCIATSRGRGNGHVSAFCVFFRSLSFPSLIDWDCITWPHLVSQTRGVSL